MLSDKKKVEKIENLLNEIDEELVSSGTNFQELVQELLELLPNSVFAIEINGVKYGDANAYEEMTWDLAQVERYFASYRKSVGL